MDHVDRAHLRDATGYSPPIFRYPSTRRPEVVRRYWLPVWDLPEGVTTTQRVLQYPSAQVVVADTYARFYGIVSGLSEIVLTGAGWACGAMLQPGAGFAVLGEPLSTVTDGWVELEPLLPGLTERVRSIMTADPTDPDAHRQAMAAVEDALAGVDPPDDEGRLMTEIAGWIEGDDEVRQVAQVADRFGLTERALQRLTRRRVGLSPKWLIQRRRLQRASEELRSEPDRAGGLADVAARLGYADQAHFTRDFRRVTAMTPGEFVSQQSAG